MKITSTAILACAALCGCSPDQSFRRIEDASSAQRLVLHTDSSNRNFDTFTFRIRGQLEGSATYTVIKNQQARSSSHIKGEFDTHVSEFDWSAQTAEVLYEPSPGSKGRVEYTFAFEKRK